MSESSPLAVFRVRPERGNLFYRVMVWRTVAEVRRAVKLHTKRAANGCYGCCCSYKVQRLHKATGQWRTKPILGVIHLAANYLGSEVVSHEMAHAALAWASRIKLDVTKPAAGSEASPEEERFCTALGQLVRQFYRQAYRRKLIA